MEIKPNIFIHIGAPKTASSFLRQYIFPAWPDMDYRRDLWFSYLALLDPEKQTIISNETLYGRPWNRDKRDGLCWFDERRRIIQGLARLYPDAQIIVCFRNPVDFIVSLYKQYLHEGGVLKINQFYDLGKDSGVIKRHDLNYMETILLLEQCFERYPFVLTLDEVKDDLRSLIKKFERLFGQEAVTMDFSTQTMVNVGVKYWQGKLLRLFNMVDKKPVTMRIPHGLFKWTNAFTRKYRIDPRSIAQHHLKNLSDRPLSFDQAQARRIRDYYSGDWESVKSYIVHNCNP